MANTLLAGLLLLALIPIAQAHDPGLSRAVLGLQPQQLSLQLWLAREDADSLTPLDADRDGVIDNREIDVARSRLASSITAGVQIQQGSRTVPSDSIHIAADAKDGLRADLIYRLAENQPLRLTFPLLRALPGGHLQHLSIQGPDGAVVQQHLLSAGAPPLVLESSLLESRLLEVRQPPGGVFGEYLAQGMHHIGIGYDHILFLLTLLLPAVLIRGKTGWMPAPHLGPAALGTVKLVSAFTLAHTITLSLAALGVISAPTAWVEPVIALSVVAAAMHNLRPWFPGPTWLLAFGFGLVHGFGFAGALTELGLPGGNLGTALLGFNLGVELGQLAIVALVFPLAALLRHRPLYHRWLLQGGSSAAAMLAGFWLLERVWNPVFGGI